MRRLRPFPSKNQGFAAATALVAIGLFVLVGAMAASTARSTAKAKMFHDTKESLVTQSDLIASTLVLCTTLYPGGDNLDPAAFAHKSYPATGTGLVADVLCPGQQPPAPAPAVPIWSTDLRAMSPRTLPGFTPWAYSNNDTNGVQIAVTANNAGDAYYQDLMDAVVRKIGPAQAVRSGDTLTVTLAR